MTILSSGTTYPLTIPAGNALVTIDLSGTSTVTGVTREDASRWHGTGAKACNPVSTATAITISTTGKVDYRLVAGDATPSSESFKYNPVTFDSTPADSAAVAAALGGQIFKPATDDDAGIRAALLAALNAGGGTVPLKEMTYTILSPLPIYSGVTVAGVAPTLSWSSSDAPDGGSTTLSGGTILQGDGTFDCFAANTDALDSPPAQFANSGKSASGFLNLGFKNFTTAIHAGGTNNPGLWYAILKNIYVTGCTSWAINLENWQHLRAEHVFSFSTTHGQRYACSINASTLSPGNSSFDHIYHIDPHDAHVSAKGIRFESYGTNAQLNEVSIGYIQCNAPSRAVLSPVAATMTNGSANIGVPDASLFEVGLPVFFDAQNTNGFNTKAIGQTYFVVSVNTGTNQIQVSNTYGGTAKNASGNTAINVGSYGYPGIELLGWNGGTFLHFTLNHIDLEPIATTGMLLQNCTSGRIGLRNVPATGTNKAQSQVCSRGSSFAIDSTYEGLILDLDAQSSVALLGCRRGVPIQHNPGFGMVRDEQYSARIGVNLTEYDRSDFYAFTSLNGDSVFFRTALQFYVQQRGSGETEAVGNGNFVTYNGAGGGSRTLPQITSDSHVGAIFSLTNTASGSITWNTSGSQTFNNKAGSTAMTIGANSSAMVQGQKIGASYIWAILGTSGTVTF